MSSSVLGSIALLLVLAGSALAGVHRDSGPEVTFTGRVLDGAGAPVAGAPAACTATRCCRIKPGRARPARILLIRSGVDVTSESVSDERSTWPPVACFTWGSGMKPAGSSPRARISSGAICASASHVVPCGSLTRTPPCTGLRPPDIITAGMGWSARS